jgi:hypothetical protein
MVGSSVSIVWESGWFICQLKKNMLWKLICSRLDGLPIVDPGFIPGQLIPNTMLPSILLRYSTTYFFIKNGKPTTKSA